jgi:D-3-phosphoglycerate dehydrogenase / 2-oxoglutarate reductase
MNVDYMTSSTIPQMKPFMRLSETMGALISQMSTSKLNLIKLSTKGGREVDITQKNARKLLCAKALHGVVRHQVHDIVPDFISAPLVANENNIRSRIEDDAVDLGQGYRNLVTVTGHYDDGKIYKVSGSVFGSTPHIVHMDYGGETSPFSFKPEGDYVLMFENDNKPGVLRDVLAVLRQSDVNVGSVNVAPFKQNKEKAFSFVILDSDIPTKALKSLQGLESVYNVVKCKMR